VKRFSVLLGVVVAVMLWAAAASAQTVAGNWKCVAKVEGRPNMEFRLQLEQDGKEVTGTASRSDGSAPIRRGSFEDGKLKLLIDADGGTYDLQATVSGNKLAGTLTHTNGDKAAWEATREGGAGGASASSIEGTWKTDQYTLEFKRDGDTLTGKLLMPDGQTIPLTKPSFANGVLRFEVGSPDGNYEAEAKLEGEKLVGTYKTPAGATRNWEAKRL
jgi:hypothetical protein